MTEQSGTTKRMWVLLPVFGILLFIMLYIVAVLTYPGGSQVNKNSIGFSWINNYWCNLLYEPAINGQHNPAKWIAITGMFVLCLALSLFWFLFPKYIETGNFFKYLIPISGTISMAISLLLFTQFNHDLVINLASSFGLMAMIGIFAGLYKNKWYGLFAFGFLNILLIGLNNYLYYKKGMIIYLPVVQKITFAIFLIWVGSMNVHLYHRALLANQTKYK